ncbi:MAG: serine/threonine-protein kinase [Sandaracinaceae bacterium]
MPPDGAFLLGEYRLLEKLGQGGMAMVYRGERQGQAGFKKTVAIKRMIPQYRRDPSLLERFAAEARTNARLDHPNLVAVVDFGVKPEPYLVMEFVEGISLASLLERLAEQNQKLEVAAACFIGAEAASGLDHAHRKRDENGKPLGIVHRDVSPQNVLLSNEGAVKVSDFGLVKAADNVVQTGSGIPIGKLSYMAPEQASHHEVDARADVFSLGIVVWEMLAMRVLIPPRDPARAAQILKACVFDPPSRYNKAVSPTLDKIVMSCLAANPAQRTPSMQAVGMALREVLHEVAPGYGRDQLARLLSWAFPERGWQLDEPHETAAQPSLEERLSMPPNETVGQAMQRPAEHASLRTEVDVKRAERMVPERMVPRPSHAEQLVAAQAQSRVQLSVVPAAKESRSVLPWVLGIAVAIGLGIIALVMVLFVVFSSFDREDDDMAPPPTPTQPTPTPPTSTSGGGGQEPGTAPAMIPGGIHIEANVPGASVFSGATRLGSTPLDLANGALGREPVVVLAAGYRPGVYEPSQIAGQPNFLVSLTPVSRPHYAVYVRSSVRGRAFIAFGGESLGPIPGVIIVPGTPLGGSPTIELELDDLDRLQYETDRCPPLEVCELDADRRLGERRRIEW